MTVKEALVLFDEVASLQHGRTSFYALAGITQAKIASSRVSATLASIQADALSDEERKRRLAELLKRREATETATGSASPNPSQGDS